MKPPNSDDFAVAQLLLDQEDTNGDEGQSVAETAGRVASKLSERLALLFGAGGVEAIWNRSIDLSKVSYPFLDTVRVQRDPSEPLAGLPESALQTNPQEAGDAFRTVLAYFVQLLFTIVGKSLTMQQLEHIWPDLGSPAKTHHANEETQ